MWLIHCLFSLRGFSCGAFNIYLTLPCYHVLAVLGIFRLHSGRAVFENAPLSAHKNKGLDARPFLLYYVGVFVSPPPGFGGGVCACDPLPPPVWVVGPSPPLPAPPPPCDPPLPLLWCVSWSLGITLGIYILLFFLLICYHKISINLMIAYAAALILLIIAFVFSQVERFDFFFVFIVRCLCVT